MVSIALCKSITSQKVLKVLGPRDMNIINSPRFVLTFVLNPHNVCELLNTIIDLSSVDNESSVEAQEVHTHFHSYIIFNKFVPNI